MNNMSSMKKSKISNYIWAAVLLAPLTVGLFIFYIIPFFQNFFYSFTNLGSFGNWSWIGLENYERLFQDQEVWTSFKNTLVYTIVSVPITIALSIAIAQLLNQQIKGKSAYRLLFFLPAITMPAAIAMIWKWIYNGQFGILNQIINFFGIDSINWISDSNFAMFALIIVGIWSGLGMNIIYFLAGLQSVPRTFYEAADIDGANPFQKFFNITLPLLSPTIFFVTITSLIKSFQMFDLLFMLISRQSNAINATKSVVYVFYQHAFEFMDKGYASAISIILFIVILIVTVIQLRLQKKWVNY